MKRIIKRFFDPLPNQPGTHCGMRLIKNPQKRPFFLLGAHGLAQLEIAPRVQIQLHILPLLIQPQIIEACKARRLRFFKIIEQATKGTGRERHNPETCRIKILYMEVFADTLFRCFRVEAFLFHRFHKRFFQPLSDKGAKLLIRNREAACENLTR